MRAAAAADPDLMLFAGETEVLAFLTAEEEGFLAVIAGVAAATFFSGD